MNILVTGGAGFIGSHLVDELLNNGYTVRAFDNLINGKEEYLNNAKQNKRFDFVIGDILSEEDCEKAFVDIDIVYHLACLGVRHSIHSPYENHKVNAEGTLNLLKHSLKNKIKWFYYISSSEVYGKTNKFPITEESITNPTTVYGASKLAGENYTNAYHECYGLNTTVIRIFNNYGPRAHYEGDAGEMIPRAIINILNNKPPVVFGDGSTKRDFFYVKDTARMLSELLKYNNINKMTLNIGTGKEISMKELAENLLFLMGKPHIGINYQTARPADVPRLWVKPDLFYSLIDFEPSYNFKVGLKETIEYFMELNQTRDLIKDIIELNWEK